MKILKLAVLLKLVLAFFSPLQCNSQTMLWNEDYTETIFFDDFDGTSLNRDKWHVNLYKRDIGMLIDSTATLNVNNGKLELTMISCPEYEAKAWNKTYIGDYAGAEIISNEKFQYGIFECRAKYSSGLGSWPAFWLIGGDGTPCPPVDMEMKLILLNIFVKHHLIKKWGM